MLLILSHETKEKIQLLWTQLYLPLHFSAFYCSQITQKELPIPAPLVPSYTSSSKLLAFTTPLKLHLWNSSITCIVLNPVNLYSNLHVSWPSSSVWHSQAHPPSWHTVLPWLPRLLPSLCFLSLLCWYLFLSQGSVLCLFCLSSLFGDLYLIVISTPWTPNWHLWLSLLSVPLGYLGTSNFPYLFNLLPKIYVTALFRISVEENLVLQVGEAKNLSHPLFILFSLTSHV